MFACSTGSPKSASGASVPQSILEDTVSRSSPGKLRMPRIGSNDSNRSRQQRQPSAPGLPPELAPAVSHQDMVFMPPVTQHKYVAIRYCSCCRQAAPASHCSYNLYVREAEVPDMLECIAACALLVRFLRTTSVITASLEPPSNLTSPSHPNTQRCDLPG